jgi:hypothetical protein
VVATGLPSQHTYFLTYLLNSTLYLLGHLFYYPKTIVPLAGASQPRGVHLTGTWSRTDALRCTDIRYPEVRRPRVWSAGLFGDIIYFPTSGAATWLVRGSGNKCTVSRDLPMTCTLPSASTPPNRVRARFYCGREDQSGPRRPYYRDSARVGGYHAPARANPWRSGQPRDGASPRAIVNPRAQRKRARRAPYSFNLFLFELTPNDEKVEEPTGSF